MFRAMSRPRLLATLVASALGVAGLALPAHAATTVTYYVSPSGSDTNTGTSVDSPFRTLGKAQSAVRVVDKSTAGTVTVYLAGGTYRLSQPLTFTAADSGTSATGTIWWRNFAGQFPVVSGGVRLTGWTLHDSAKNVWQATAPSTLDTRQLYVNGARATRATGSIPVSVTQTATGYTTATSNPMAGWGNRSAIEFVYRGGLGLWTEPRCPVASISSSAITMAQPCWNNSTRRVMRTDGSGRTYELVGRQSITEAPTAVENAYELLDAPGEWYLDRSTHTVYYVPRSGQNLATADVAAPALQTLVSTTGTRPPRRTT
jgi:hypothetical protein